jgi:putative spermidine/putrescine transport system permease protein
MWRRRHLGVKVAGYVLLVLLAVPLIVLIGVSLNPGVEQVFPPQGISLRWYYNLANRSGFVPALQMTLILAVGSTIVSTTVGLLAGIALTRFEFPGKDFILTLILSPLIVPQVVVGMAFLVTLSGLGIVTSLLSLSLLHCVITLPFTARAVVSALATSSRSLEEAAQSLGATPARAFLSVTLPIVRPVVIAAAIFAFVTSFENFTASQFLVWDRTTLPVELYNYVQTENDPTAAALSSLILLPVVLLVIVFNRFIAKHMFSGRF